MKRKLNISLSALFIVTAAIITFVILKNSNKNTTSEVSQAAQSVIPEESPSGDTDEQKDTLLIYMIGSDLESRAGAGTNDLDEIANSGTTRLFLRTKTQYLRSARMDLRLCTKQRHPIWAIPQLCWNF